MAINYRPTLNGDDRREMIKFGLKNYYMDEEGMSAAQAESALLEDLDYFATKPSNGWTDWKDILFKMVVIKITKLVLREEVKNEILYISGLW